MDASSQIRTLIVAAAALLALAQTPARDFNHLCDHKDEIDRGINCELPFDSTGRPIFYSERVIGKVTAASRTRDQHGLYSFSATLGSLELHGRSRVRPVVGESVEIIVRMVLHTGKIVRDQPPSQ